MGKRKDPSVVSASSFGAHAHYEVQPAAGYRRMSTGLRIVGAADDPSGLGAGERLRARIHDVQTGQRGADLTSLMQGAVAATGSLLARLL